DTSLRRRTGTVVKLISPSSFSEQRRLSGETCIGELNKMAWTAKFLLPFRQSFSQSRNLCKSH
ncbi:hypothetical protein Gogos_003045, partial [Gossypium gossypioides]|nr:hypothetical protein [Gossypium gossypioides]